MSSFPACLVCQQKLSLKGPDPFLLPCLHAVCETCVTSAVGGVISCSTCQRDVNLTETPLQKDVIREKEILHLTVQHNPELVLCTHEDDGNQAVCWCKECEGFLCEHCQNVHGSFKGTKQHTIYDVGELEVGNLIEDRYCRVHPKFIADTWDTHCCMLTCRKCRLGDHSDHEAVDVEDASKASRKKIETFQDEVKSFVEQHKAHATAATKDLQKSEKSSSTLPENISHTFHSLKTLIDQREVELRIAHQQQKETAERFLHEKKNSADVCLQRCQTTSDFISKTLKYSSVHDVVELRPLLEEKSKDCRSSAPSEDYNSLPLPVFNTEGLWKIKSNLGKFGAITTDDDVLETETEDIGQTEHNVEETQQFEEELKQGRTSVNRLARNNKEVKTGFAGVIIWMRSVDKRLVMFIATVAVTIILSALIQQISEYETQTEIMTQRLRQMETSKDNLIKEKWEIVKDYETRLEIMTQKLRHMETSEEHLIKEKREIERDFDSLKMSVLVNSYVLDRPHVEFSRTKYNADRVHINDDGELINIQQTNSPLSDRISETLHIISSTEPLPPSGSPLYLEVKMQVVIKETLPEKNILFGAVLAPKDKALYGMVLGHASHGTISTMVWRNDKEVMALPDTLANAKGTSATLHYGVVYDSIRQRVALLDLKGDIIIDKMDNVDSSVALWPMFLVCHAHVATVSMSLVVGNDIDITESKKALILESLS